MSELKTMLRVALGDERPSPNGLRQVIERSERRARRRRRATVGLALGMSAASAMFVWRALGTGGSTPGSEGASNYRFADIRVEQDTEPPTGLAVPGEVRVAYRIEWTSDSYPGTHRCTTTVYGPDGSVVGDNTATTVSAAPSDSASMRIEVSGPASSATISCDPERLDVGQPYAYENASKAAALNAVSTHEVLDQVSNARYSPAQVTVGGYTFTVDAFEWTELKNGEYVPVLGPDQDARLSECGHDSWPGSMGTYGPIGGFCISSIDFADHESIVAARVLAKRLYSGTEYSDAEINALRLWTLAGYADPDSEEAARYYAEFEAARDALTPAEREHTFS